MNSLTSLSIEGNLPDRIRELERRIYALQMRETRAGQLSDIAADVGTFSSGVNLEGGELIVNGDFSTGDSTGWSASTGVQSWNGAITGMMSGTLNAISDRFALGTEGLVRFSFEGGGNSPISTCTAKIEWYDSLAGGNLVYTDLLPDLMPVVLNVPAGAVAARWNVTGTVSGGAAGFDNFSARAVTYSQSLELEPVPTLTIEGIPQRIVSGARAFYDPGFTPALKIALVSTGAGNLTNGSYRYRITYLDEFGETLPGWPSAGVTVDATHKRISVSLPTPPAGCTGLRLYRTAANGSAFGLVTMLAAGTATYEDNTADANLGAAPPEENTTLGRAVAATFAYWPLHVMGSSTALTWATHASHGDYFTQTSPANGDLLRIPGAFLERGRYTFSALGITGPSRPIFDVFMDGAPIVRGWDWYTASVGYRTVKTFQFPVPVTGWHDFVLVINGKNASSTDYKYYLTDMWVEKTSR